MGSEEDYVYQLRRTGASATYPNIKDVMKLKMGVTRFGRSTDNDYYLDSAKLKNFISRSHAEIHAKKSEDGQYVFVLHNKGLNGTFINDIKMNQFILLQEGDKITFGHTNGFKLEPGQRANQPNSEFEFVFEKVPARFAEADSTSGEVRDGKILSSPESEHKKSPKSPKSPSKIKRQSDINSYLSKHSKDPDKVDIKSHESSVSPDHRSYDLSSPEAKYSERSMSPLIPQPPRESSTLVMSEEDNFEDNDEKSDVQSYSSFSESVRESKKKTRETKSFSYVEDSDDDDDDINDNDYLKNGTRNIKPKATRGRKKSSPPKSSRSPPTKRKVSIPPVSRHDNSSSDEDDSPRSIGEANPYRFSDDSDSDTQKKKAKPKGRPPGSKNKVPSGVGRGGGPKPGAGRGRGRKAKSVIPPPPQVEFDFPDDDDDDDDDILEKKKRKQPEKPPEQAKKKRGRQPSSTAESYSELEEGVEWYEEEKCAADKCKRPKNKRVKWVQCDLCDEWYHTVCVGCQYEAVKDQNIEFSCGYCQ